MADKIILAEDTTALRDALAEALKAEGFEVLAVADGVSAEQAAMDGSAALVVLDLLLPKKQGLAVAEALRGAGVNTPLMMMSGILKGPAQQKEAKDKFGVKEYLLKPFEVDAFVAAVNSTLGRGAAGAAAGGTGAAAGAAGATPGAQAAPDAIPPRGVCTDTPPGLIIFRVQNERLSGVLDVANGNDRARLFFHRGALVFAQSSRPDKHLGTELVKMGQLSPTSLAAGMKAMATEGVGLYKSLITQGLTDDAHAKEAYKRLAPSILTDAVAMPGRFRWTVSDGFLRMLPAINIGVLPILFEALKATPPLSAERLLETRKQVRIQRGPNFDRFQPAVESNFGPDVARAINGRARMGQIVEAAQTPQARMNRMVQMFAMLCVQAAVASDTDVPYASAAPSNSATNLPPIGGGAPAPAARAPTGQIPAARSNPAPAAPTPAAAAPGGPPPPLPMPAGIPPEVVEVLKDVETRFAAMATQTHFEVLGVPPDVDLATLKKTFFALAGRFHEDRFSGVGLGDWKDRVDAVFARLNEAYDVLGKPERRAEYEAELKMKAAGSTMDVAAIFEAESNFSKAEVIMARGDMAAAKKLLDRAMELDPKDLYKAYQLYTSFHAAGRPKASAPGLIKQLEELGKATSVPRLSEMLAFVAKAGEDYKAAKRYFRMVMDDPEGNKNMAQRELANIQKLEAEAKDKAAGGVMGKLFKS